MKNYPGPDEIIQNVSVLMGITFGYGDRIWPRKLTSMLQKFPVEAVMR